MSWTERINTERNIETFTDEQSIIDHLNDADIKQLNWMKIFNSKIELSNTFISHFVDRIQWNWLIRPLDEPMLERFHLRVLQWNAQLYGRPLTYEFLVKYQDRIDWKLLSRNPPEWFNDIYYSTFGSKMDWALLAPHYQKIDCRLLTRFAGKVNWEWVSAHDIRSERFAIVHLYDINWDHPCLDVSHLSTEFLYDLYEVRRLAYKMMVWPISPMIKPKNRLMPFLSTDLVKDYDPQEPPRLGATIGLKFAIDHRDLFNWNTLYANGLIDKATLKRLKSIRKKSNDLKISETQDESPTAKVETI